MKIAYNKLTRLSRSVPNDATLGIEETFLEPVGLNPIWNKKTKKWEEKANNQEIFIHEEENKLLLTMEKYNKYRADGFEYYNIIQAKIALSVNSSKLDIAIAFQIEAIIKPYMDKIKSGDWATTNFLMQSLSSQNTIIQGWIDQIKLYVSDYHTNNY